MHHKGVLPIASVIQQIKSMREVCNLLLDFDNNFFLNENANRNKLVAILIFQIWWFNFHHPSVCEYVVCF